MALAHRTAAVALLAILVVVASPVHGAPALSVDQRPLQHRRLMLDDEPRSQLLLPHPDAVRYFAGCYTDVNGYTTCGYGYVGAIIGFVSLLVLIGIILYVRLRLRRNRLAAEAAGQPPPFPSDNATADNLASTYPQHYPPATDKLNDPTGYPSSKPAQPFNPNTIDSGVAGVEAYQTPIPPPPTHLPQSPPPPPPSNPIPYSAPALEQHQQQYPQQIQQQQYYYPTQPYPHPPTNPANTQTSAPQGPYASVLQSVEPYPINPAAAAAATVAQGPQLHIPPSTVHIAGTGQQSSPGPYASALDSVIAPPISGASPQYPEVHVYSPEGDRANIPPPRT